MTDNSEGKNKENSKRIKRLDSIYERVLTLRNFEITNLNNRNTFMWAVNAALFTYVSNQRELNILLPMMGIVISILQVQMAAGAKFWQEAWEIKLNEVEHKLYQVYQDENKTLENNDKFIHLFTTEENADNAKLNIEHKSKSRIEKIKIEVERNLNKEGCLNEGINKLILNKYSVSRVPIYLGIWTGFFWGVLLISKLCGCN